jgi:arylsulfatase A-like enzyme
MEAHDPWSDVPGGIDWVPATEGLAYFRDARPDPWESYVTGAFSEREAAAFRERITNLYDHAVSKADRVLGEVIDTLDAYGWTSAGLRLIVVSDHGEFLGEHGLARHGRYLWEANNRVPLVVYDSNRPTILPPDPVSALDVFELTATGRIANPRAAEAAAYPDGFWLSRSNGRIGGSTSVALWRGNEKLLWRDGELRRYDLASDAQETSGAGATASASARIDELVEAVRLSGARGGTLDPQLAEALRTVGYIE